MQISNTLNTNIFNHSNTTSGKTASNESFEFSSAVTKSEEQDGEFLGLTMLPEEGKHNIYGMRAKLSSQSTIDNPIVQVISNFDGKKEVFDVTGAGDTVVAAFTLALCAGLSPKEAMVVGNLAASIVIRQFGCHTTNLEELKAELNNIKEI